MLNFECTIIQCVLPCGEKTSRWDLTMLKQAVLCDLLLSQTLYSQKSSFRNKTVSILDHTCACCMTQILALLALQVFSKSNLKEHFTYIHYFANWVTQLCGWGKMGISWICCIRLSMLFLFHHLRTEEQFKNQIHLITFKYRSKSEA